MRRIAVINQKGGVGKTTSTVNIGAGLARAGHRVLMIDLDPQAHMTLHLGLNPADERPGIYQLLTGSAQMDASRTRVANNLWVVGASIDLAAAEIELVSVVGREVILRDLLEQHATNGDGTFKYDYVLFDCPPSLGVLTLNGLCAAKEVLIPLQPHYLALQGLSKLLETVSLVSRRINPDLVVCGIPICMKEAGTRLGAEVIEDVRSFLESSRHTPMPWRDARLFVTQIRRNIKLAEAPSYGQSIFDYAPDSNGAKDYEALAAELHDPAAANQNAPAAHLSIAETASPPELATVASASEVSSEPEAQARELASSDSSNGTVIPLPNSESIADRDTPPPFAAVG